MRSIKEQLILVYCLADDGLKSEKNGGNWRKSNNQPKCTDAEIIAVAMMQSYFGCATLKRTFLLVVRLWFTGFSWLAGLQTMAGETASLEFSNGSDFRAVFRWISPI